MGKSIEGVYAKNHGHYKKGEKGTFEVGTLRALQAHGILEQSAEADKLDKEDKAEAKKPKKGKAEAITSKPKKAK